MKPDGYDPVEYAASRFEGAKKSPNGYEVRCPAHDDRHASLSIGYGAKGQAVLHCHAGCDNSAILPLVGLTWGDLFPADKHGKEIVATYDYCDADGTLLFQVVRYRPKDFRQRRPDGNGGWVWKLGRQPRVLYRLPELVTADPAAWVFIVEGEKDVDRLLDNGLVATTCPGGAGKWKNLYDDSALNGRKVVLVPDKDDPGRKHAVDVAMHLRGRATALKTVELPGKGKDVSAWLDAGGTIEQLLKLADEAPEAVDTRLIEWIKKHSGTVSVRDVLAGPREYRGDAGKVRAALTRLVDAGAGLWIEGEQTGNGGWTPIRFRLQNGGTRPPENGSTRGSTGPSAADENPTGATGNADTDGRTRNSVATGLCWLGKIGNSTNEFTYRNSDRPEVVIDTEEYHVVKESIVALLADDGLYQRGSVLVRVIRDELPKDLTRRSPGSPIIQILPTANLRERMTRVTRFMKLNKDGDKIDTHPTGWLVAQIEARAEWDGIRYLVSVSDAPVLRDDGSVWQTPGYDHRTGVLFEVVADTVFPPVPEHPTLDDARKAADVVLDAVCDFPFLTKEHRAAWLASLLTPLSRCTFGGPSPLFLFDSNVPGAGKTTMAQVIGHIVLGRNIPTRTYVHDPEEMRKGITSLAIAGDPLVLFDNLKGPFGNDALDRALTTTRWQDRILGKNEEISLPLTPAWYATGNNVQVVSDTIRRIIHIRMDCMEEKPDERGGWKHHPILSWVDQQRGVLIVAALTILSAFLKAGRPCHDLKPFGSFEGWSTVVREAVVWIGLDDPCETRKGLAESTDLKTDVLAQLIDAMRLYDPYSEGIEISTMLHDLYPLDRNARRYDEASVAMRTALEELVGCAPDKAPTARRVGNNLRSLRNRVVDGLHLHSEHQTSHKKGLLWTVRT